MVQRKTGHDRFGQEHERSLRPETMKRPRPSKQTTPEKQKIVAKVTSASPNYMKGTNSSEARKHSQGGSDKKMQTGKKLDSCSGDKKESVRVFKKGVSFKRSYRIGIFGDVNAHRATCSSFLKDSKFTEYLTHTSPGLLKLCPYKYCSLSHLQFPPLKSFISAKRRSLKSQTNLRMSGDDGCIDMQVIDSEAEYMETQWGETEDLGSESLLVESEDIESKEASCNDDLQTLADAEYYGPGHEKIDMMIDKFAIIEQSENVEDQESFLDNSTSFLLVQDGGIIYSLLGNDLDEKLTSNKAKDWEVTDGEKAEECTKDWREFNPRGPNYLPIVEEPSSEKVELKHQDMDERKNAEWMIDYALQHTVSKLALERKKKVALLVEAFETVLPREPSPVCTYGRHLQACN